jgi:predicted nucleic acid-binding protein
MLLDEKDQVANGDTFLVLTESELIVPSHWPAEVGNALLVNIRRGRLSPGRLAAIVERLNIFRFEVQHAPPLGEIEERVRSALKAGLTYYDALYIQLAAERRVPLFSLDRRMRKAASAGGVGLLPAL